MNNWISVNDRLPLLYESVLCFTADGGYCIAQLHDYFGEKEWYCYSVKIRNVTHWIPLPSSPYAKTCYACAIPEEMP